MDDGFVSSHLAPDSSKTIDREGSGGSGGGERQTLPSRGEGHQTLGYWSHALIKEAQ